MTVQSYAAWMACNNRQCQAAAHVTHNTGTEKQWNSQILQDNETLIETGLSTRNEID